MIKITTSCPVAQEKWKPVRKDIENCIDLRNALAHFELSLFDPSMMATQVKGKTDYPVCISPHHLDVRSLRNGTVKGLFVESLQEIAETYRKMPFRILGFARVHVPDWMQQVARLPPHSQQALETIEELAKATAPSQPHQS